MAREGALKGAKSTLLFDGLEEVTIRVDRTRKISIKDVFLLTRSRLPASNASTRGSRRA